MVHPRIGLRGLIALSMVVIAVVPSVVILPMLADLSRSITQRQAAVLLQTTAQAVADQLAIGLEAQWLQVRRLARFVEQGDDAARLRLRLDTIVETDRQFAWIGLADPAGTVLTASAGVLDGASVGERPWFKAGLAGSFAGDVHDAQLLQKYVAPNAPEPLRLIDFALPVRRPDGVPLGVLGAHVRWQAVRDLVKASRGDGSIELMLLARDGVVLVGPRGMEGQRLSLASALASTQGIARTTVETWEDGRQYLTTALPGSSRPDVPSFGWSLVARQPVAVALVDTYAATARLLPVILACGIAIVLACLAVGWWVARPLGRLVRAAESLGDGTLAAPVPHERLYAEVSRLSEALARLDSLSPRGGAAERRAS